MEEVLFLDACLDKVKAEKEVFHRNLQYDLTPDKVRDLTFQLTDDEDEAEKAWAWQWLNKK